MSLQPEPCAFCKKDVVGPCANSMLAATCSQCAPDADKLQAVADALANPFQTAPAARVMSADYKPAPVVTNTPRPGDSLEQLAARAAPRNVSAAPRNPNLSVQIGGDHYSKMAIQPLTYIQANKIGFEEGNVIKYVSRWENKNGVEDLKKARDILDKKIAFEEAQAASGLMEYLSALFKSV